MIRCILTDIEGTTSSIEFVHKVLFPYARANFFDFLNRSQDAEVQSLARRFWTEELGYTHETKIDLKAVSERLQGMIDQDIKNGILKALQGKIWREGYESAAYHGHVYPDVLPQLQKWQKQGLRLAVYSSGSVEAQKLLFGHSDKGDLTPYFTDYFDTAVGHKREAPSYQNIIGKLGFDASSILFLSDIKEELDAAAAAGMKTCQLLRDPLPVEGTHPKAKTFYDVDALIA